MAERRTQPQSEDIQKDFCDSTELDLSSCTGSYQESNPAQSSSFGNDRESQGPAFNDVNMACSDDGSSDIDDGASAQKKKLDHSSERETSHVDEKSKRAKLAKKKRGKAKVVNAKDGRSDHFSCQEGLEDSSSDEESNTVSLAKKKRGKSKAVKKERKTRVKIKRPWNEAEKEVIERHFGIFITQRRIPRKEHCVKFLREENGLGDRSVRDVRNYVYKTITAQNHRSASRRLYF
ncbi:uncharacterized protein LOC115789884 [Archocentrus centrarchus]|uniref:uncharacterized protein LOC115789884 n=1 Tax=Archocentrus centrarchus TaxID=63155 RepID=UPI0011E9ED3D|nr:uncharacterized protein LOC115789884 [Archocentrus centrarchus]